MNDQLVQVILNHLKIDPAIVRYGSVSVAFLSGGIIEVTLTAFTTDAKLFQDIQQNIIEEKP